MIVYDITLKPTFTTISQRTLNTIVMKHGLFDTIHVHVKEINGPSAVEIHHHNIIDKLFFVTHTNESNAQNDIFI